MSDTDKNEQPDELDLAEETVEDLDAEGDDVKGGKPRETENYACN